MLNDDGETFLSDVHVDKVICNDGGNSNLQLTRFVFSTPAFNQSIDSGGLSDDHNDDEEDTDLEPFRNDDTSCNDEVITVYHTMSTELSKVGLQVWRGALLMCDFIVHNPEVFSGEHVLELGSGTGLTGVVLAFHSQSVTLSDTGPEVLSLCKQNVKANERLLNCPVDVVDLDWTRTDQSTLLTDFERLPTCIVACDCVYENDCTDALFRTMFFIMKTVCDRSSSTDNETQPITVYLSLEKRINFSLIDKCVVSHEYDHFRACLNELCEISHKNYNFRAHQVALDDVPTYFSYTRVKQIELWKIVAQSR